MVGLAALNVTLEFSLCGNYCGPGYCGGEQVAEGPLCDLSVAEVGCSDECCKLQYVSPLLRLPPLTLPETDAPSLRGAATCAAPLSLVR